MKEQLKRIPALSNPQINIEVATVDGFQGSECDIIILSCVRSHSNSWRGKISQLNSFDTRVLSTNCSSFMPRHIPDKRRNAVGFLSDNRRANVALTRAKFSLWIVGNAEVLQSSDLWRKLIRDMDRNRAIRHADVFRDMFSRWKASKELAQRWQPSPPAAESG